MEILSSHTQSLKAICPCKAHMADVDPSKQTQRHRECHVMLSALNSFWDKYASMVLWLKRGQTCDREQHRQEATELKISYRGVG